MIINDKKRSGQTVDKIFPVEYVGASCSLPIPLKL